MSDIDVFASSLLNEAKRFLERAKDAKGGDGEKPNLHAALMLAFCSLEAHVNAVSDELSKRSDLTPHEKGILLEKEVQLIDGTFKVSQKLRIWRMEDRIDFLHSRFSLSGSKIQNPNWRADLNGATSLRNGLTHPKTTPLITVSAIENSVIAVIDSIDALYRAIYGRPFPAAALNLTSSLDF